MATRPERVGSPENPAGAGKPAMAVRPAGPGRAAAGVGPFTSLTDPARNTENNGQDPEAPILLSSNALAFNATSHYLSFCLNLKEKKNIMLNNLLSIKLSISSGPEITRTLGAILDNLL